MMPDSDRYPSRRARLRRLREAVVRAFAISGRTRGYVVDNAPSREIRVRLVTFQTGSKGCRPKFGVS